REFSIEIDPRTTDANRIFKLAEMGINRLSLGVQDVEPIVQKAVNRVQSIEETVEVIDSARAAGFKSISLDLIYGLPHQTIDSFAKTIEKVLEFRPDRLAIYNYAHMPEIFMPQKRILEKDLPSSDDKLKILSNTIQRLIEAGYVYIGMDHFALPDDELVLAQEKGQLQRNFQGYSTHGHCDLIGLGPSAIGQISGTFAQNAKDLNQYYEMLAEATLPVVKGYTSSDDDLMRKEIIQEVMCHHRLGYEKIERVFNVDFKDYFRPELEVLKTLNDDGLIEFCNGGFNVTAKGRILLRHVAMVFDAYLKVPGKKARFSKVI
ncbi:MAG: oxygen-independent coproporphyrinogen III oxidase, partial [bacterium]